MKIKKEKELNYANCMKVVVETNTPKGGDAGYGGITKFYLEDLGGTNWDIIVDGNAIKQPEKIEIRLLADSEAEVLANLLLFAGNSLKKQIKENLKNNNPYKNL